MAGNSMKPCSGHWTSGNYGNQPVFTDGTTTSPIAQSLTKTLTVPKSAVRLVVENPTGSSGAVTVSCTGKSGNWPMVAGTCRDFDCAGMRDAADGFVASFVVATAASTTANFMFVCTTPDGA